MSHQKVTVSIHHASHSVLYVGIAAIFIPLPVELFDLIVVNILRQIKSRYHIGQGLCGASIIDHLPRDCGSNFDNRMDSLTYKVYSKNG